MVERPWMTLKTRARKRAPGRRVYGRTGMAKSTKGAVNIRPPLNGLRRQLGGFLGPKLPSAGTHGTRRVMSDHDRKPRFPRAPGKGFGKGPGKGFGKGHDAGRR